MTKKIDDLFRKMLVNSLFNDTLCELSNGQYKKGLHDEIIAESSYESHMLRVRISKNDDVLNISIEIYEDGCKVDFMSYCTDGDTCSFTMNKQSARKDILKLMTEQVHWGILSNQFKLSIA